MLVRFAIGAVVAAAGLALPAPAADAKVKRFAVRAPAPGNVVIAQIRGTAPGRVPPRLALRNPKALGGTIVAYSVWRAKSGSAFDGVLVLLNPATRTTAATGAAPSTALLSAAVNTIVVGPLQSSLATLLGPAVQKVREAAARTQCANNLKTLGLSRHSFLGGRAYFDRTFGPSPRTFVRQVCAAATDDAIAGSPQFWDGFDLPFCNFAAAPFGTAGDEIVVTGSCNRPLDRWHAVPPDPFIGSACLGSDGWACRCLPHGVFFANTRPPATPFVEFSGNIRVAGPGPLPSGWAQAWNWSATVAGPNELTMPFPIDPSAGLADRRAFLP